MKERGFAVWGILILLSMLAHLLLMQSENMLLYFNASWRMKQHVARMRQIETMMQSIHPDTASCLISSRSAIQASLLHQQGCVWSKEQVNIYYNVFDLGAFPCLQMQTPQGLVGTHHWLITARWADSTWFLQQRVAQPLEDSYCTTTQHPYFLHSSLLSWVLLK